MSSSQTSSTILEQARSLSKTQIINLRKQNFPTSLSISYENTEPLYITHGKGSYLYDDQNNKYLDTRNNVCHVGHQNPKVVKAVCEQVSILNTNTRYLHPNICLLSEKLLETMPTNSILSSSKNAKVFFVNSGSEANDLAIRLAYSYNERKGKIVVDHAYHGHTKSVIEISPYKYKKSSCPEGPQPENTFLVDCPDLKFGRFHKVDDYISQVDKIVDQNSSNIGAIFIESGMSVGGVILPPEGYMSSIFNKVRSIGAVCVCDEVQVGFGRFGNHFWAFQQQNVVPDIVTMGKPFGNGMPLAAVVCSEEIATAFSQGPEYFNTFGGNPVSAAAGLAVMDELLNKESGLQENAKITGDYWKNRLLSLKEKCHEHTTDQSIILDIRGQGFFIGLHLNDSRLASYVVGALKNKYKILTSIDGPENNVIVFKPPMCFSKEEVDVLVEAIEEIIFGIDFDEFYKGEFTHCPT